MICRRLGESGTLGFGELRRRTMPGVDADARAAAVLLANRWRTAAESGANDGLSALSKGEGTERSVGAAGAAPRLTERELSGRRVVTIGLKQ